MAKMNFEDFQELRAACEDNGEGSDYDPEEILGYMRKRIFIAEN